MTSIYSFIARLLIIYLVTSLSINVNAQSPIERKASRQKTQKRPIPTSSNTSTSDDDSWLYIIGGGVVALGFIVLVLSKNNKEEEVEQEEGIDRNNLETYQAHLIQDKDVTVDKVLESIREMKPAINPERKNGFTELDIEKQMLNHLRNIYQNVRNQKQMQDSNSDGTRWIDIDVGHGKVGVEIKAWHKSVNRKKREDLLFQLNSYKESDYEKENVIAVVAGFNDIFRHPDIGKLEEEIIKRGHKFTFLNAGEPS